jgi:hypothetical protein
MPIDITVEIESSKNSRLKYHILQGEDGSLRLAFYSYSESIGHHNRNADKYILINVVDVCRFLQQMLWGDTWRMTPWQTLQALIDDSALPEKPKMTEIHGDYSLSIEVDHNRVLKTNSGFVLRRYTIYTGEDGSYYSGFSTNGRSIGRPREISLVNVPDIVANFLDGRRLPACPIS